MIFWTLVEISKVQLVMKNCSILTKKLHKIVALVKKLMRISKVNAKLCEILNYNNNSKYRESTILL